MQYTTDSIQFEVKTIRHNYDRKKKIDFKYVQFKMVAMCSEKHNVLHPVSQTSFPNVAFGTVLTPVGRTPLIDDGPFSSFQRRSSSASSFHASLSPGDQWCDVLGFVPDFK